MSPGCPSSNPMPVTGKSSTPPEEKDEWRTLPELYAALNAEFKFNYDFAATKGNALAKHFFTKANSALEQEVWFHNLNIAPSGFLNPPFSMFKEFLAKANEQIKWAGDWYGYGTIVCIIKHDALETAWLRDNLVNEDGVARHELRIFWPRIPYLDPTGTEKRGPKFGTGAIIMRPKPWHHIRWVNWKNYTSQILTPAY